MKRSFADYIRYFSNEPSTLGKLARLLSDDPGHILMTEDKQLYEYLIHSERYLVYVETIEKLYQRYISYSS